MPWRQNNPWPADTAREKLGLGGAYVDASSFEFGGPEKMVRYVQSPIDWAARRKARERPEQVEPPDGVMRWGKGQTLDLETDFPNNGNGGYTTKGEPGKEQEPTYSFKEKERKITSSHSIKVQLGHPTNPDAPFIDVNCIVPITTSITFEGPKRVKSGFKQPDEATGVLEDGLPGSSLDYSVKTKKKKDKKQFYRFELSRGDAFRRIHRISYVWQTVSPANEAPPPQPPFNPDGEPPPAP